MLQVPRGSSNLLKTPFALLNMRKCPDLWKPAQNYKLSLSPSHHLRVTLSPQPAFRDAIQLCSICGSISWLCIVDATASSYVSVDLSRAE